jgi:hypothetical protein
MRTISLCIRGLPICEIFWIPARSHMGTSRMHTGISFWCVSDLSSSHAWIRIFTCVAQWIRILWMHNIMHMPHPKQIAWHEIPVCIWGSRSIPVCIRGLHVMGSPYAYRDQNQSPYAYGDRRDPRMHMGIAWHVIPVCIWGFVRSPYAYGDISVTNRMHTGNISIWEIKSCIPICVISPYGDRRMHMEIPVCERAGIAKKFAYGDPRTHNEIVRIIWGLTYIYNST